MSQLPEVEVTRKDLEKDVVGKRVKDVTVRAAGLVPRHRNRPDFVKALVGRKIDAVSRRGVHLVFALEDGTALVARLGDHGTFSRETATTEPGKHTQFVAAFTTGGALHYTDPGRDADFVVLPVADVATLPELEKHGIDPLADTFTWHAVGEELVRRGGPLKPLLLDPSFIVGLGDMYSDEVLWAAGLRGNRPALSLSSQEVRRLYRAVLEVLHEAVKQRTAGGVPASSDDDADADEDDSGAWLKVWGREGLPCMRCRQPVQYGVVVDGCESYHCANCQT